MSVVHFALQIPQRKTSRGERSGKQGGLDKTANSEIAGNKLWMVVMLMWAVSVVAPSCWNHKASCWGRQFISGTKKMFKHVGVALWIDRDSVPIVVLKEGKIIPNDKVAHHTVTFELWKICWWRSRVVHGPVTKILSIHCNSLVELHFITHQQIVLKIWPVFHKIQQNCATIYMFPMIVGQQLCDLQDGSVNLCLITERLGLRSTNSNTHVMFSCLRTL